MKALSKLVATAVLLATRGVAFRAIDNRGENSNAPLPDARLAGGLAPNRRFWRDLLDAGRIET